MAQNDDSGLTEKYGDIRGPDSQATQKYDSGTGLPVREGAHLIHGISEGDILELNGESYKMIRILSMAGAEAVVYLGENSRGEKRVLKLYYPFQFQEDEPNREALERIKVMNDPNILKLYDYGTGKNKYKGKFCYEIVEFARGGDLLNLTKKNFAKKYTEKFLTAVVVPEILAGIKTLHKNKIFHGDLKPHNVFFLDEDQSDIVIGDYGSSKTFEQASEKSLAYTVMAKGTNFYISPEQARGVISEKNDFYSFGMILLHLLYPEFVNQEMLRKIVERQFSKKPIVDYNKKYGRLNHLIAGLTLQDLDARWGESEVKRWMEGEGIPVRYSGEIQNETFAEIKLGSATIRSAEDLIHQLKVNPDWYDILIADSSGRQLLFDWIAKTYDLEKKNVFKKMIEYYEKVKEADAKYFVRESIIRFLKPDRPILMSGTEFDLFSAEEPASAVNDFINALDDHWKSARSLSSVKNYIFLLEFSLRKLRETLAGGGRARVDLILDKIASVFSVKEVPDFKDYRALFFQNVTDQSVVELCYAFNPERKFRDDAGVSISDPEGIARFFAANKDTYRSHKMTAERYVYFNKIGLPELADAVYEDFIFHALRNHIKAEMNILNFQPMGKNHAVSIRIYKNLNDYFSANGIAPEATGLAGGLPALKENSLRKFSESVSNRMVSGTAKKIAGMEEKWESRKKKKKEKKASDKEQEIQPPSELPKEIVIQLPDADDETFIEDFWSVVENRLSLPRSKFSELNINHAGSVIRNGLSRYRTAVQHAIELEKIKKYKTRMMSYFIPTSGIFPVFSVVSFATLVFSRLYGSENKAASLPFIDTVFQGLGRMANVYPWTQDPAFADEIFARGFYALISVLLVYVIYFLSLLPPLLFVKIWEPDERFGSEFIRKSIVPLSLRGAVVYMFFLFPVTVMGFANFPRLYIYFHLLSVFMFSCIYCYNSVLSSQTGYRVFADHYANLVGINTRIQTGLLVPAAIAGIVFIFLYAVLIDFI